MNAAVAAAANRLARSILTTSLEESGTALPPADRNHRTAELTEVSQANLWRPSPKRRHQLRNRRHAQGSHEGRNRCRLIVSRRAAELLDKHWCVLPSDRMPRTGSGRPRPSRSRACPASTLSTAIVDPVPQTVCPGSARTRLSMGTPSGR